MKKINFKKNLEINFIKFLKKLRSLDSVKAKPNPEKEKTNALALRK